MAGGFLDVEKAIEISPRRGPSKKTCLEAFWSAAPTGPAISACGFVVMALLHRGSCGLWRLAGQKLLAADDAVDAHGEWDAKFSSG